MKNIVLILLTSILLFSCSSEKVPNVEAVPESKEIVTVETLPDYSNPLFMEGSTFGDYFRALYRTGNSTKMLEFTSNETKEKFGTDNLLKFFDKMRFGYQIDIKSNKITSDTTQTLIYNADIMATERIIKINVVVENDTTKLVLDSLNVNNPF